MSDRKPIRILHLYPRDMNIYGDWGNILVLKRRLEWHGYEAEVVDYNPGDDFPTDVELVIGGGGQDNGQDAIQTDLLTIGPLLIELAQSDTPMLMVCGLYQLFGHYFQTSDGRKIEGIGLFDMQTVAGPERLIGNIVTKSDMFGTIIGYENHSGLTTLGDGMAPFGTVVRGAGNNGRDHTEGVHYKNVIGTYLHGSLLPKNPSVADYLIRQSIQRKHGDFSENIIDDRFADEAREIARHRPR